jgi:N-glycosylase/DNA lyase
MCAAINIAVPAGFNFRTAVNSHGWCELSPFSLDTETWTLHCVFNDPGSGPVDAAVRESFGGLSVETERAVDDIDSVSNAVRHILRLDEDLGGFYRLTGRFARLAWVAELNAGRLLRSPTVFEDLVKTICTTNCSWNLTRSMTDNLVGALGQRTPSGRRAFPTAAAMAEMDETFYRDVVRAGYRAPYLVELACGVAAGVIDPESWLCSDLPTAELKKKIKGVKGVGEYAADNLLKLVGRYDGLALDSWLRSQFYAKHNSGESCEDAVIRDFYEEFGAWRGLAIWCDMTEKWH